MGPAFADLSLLIKAVILTDSVPDFVLAFIVTVLDVLFTFLLAKFIQYHLLEEWDFLLILICCFAVGIILHRVFCVKTTIDKLLFS